jgi:hypothetical protein
MKPYVLVLLMGAIACFAELIRRGKASGLPLRPLLPLSPGAGNGRATEPAMGRAMRRQVLVLSLLLSVLTIPTPGFAAQTHDAEVEIGTSLICDTRAQVERFVALYDGDAKRAVDSVNAAEHNPTACAVTTMAYVRGPRLATARAKDASFQIVPILVLGLVTEDGLKSVTPAPFFSVFEIDEIGV